MDKSMSPVPELSCSLYPSSNTVKTPQVFPPKGLNKNAPQQMILSQEAWDHGQTQNIQNDLDRRELKPAQVPVIDRELKMMSKRERNKLYCANWRQKQKEKEVSLQNELEALRTENKILRDNNSMLLTENIQLKNLLLKLSKSF